MCLLCREKLQAAEDKVRDLEHANNSAVQEKDSLIREINQLRATKVTR